jgi:hypothetical protein
LEGAPANKFGTCALCQAEGTLRHSHIIPEFLYAPIYDEKHRMLLLETDERYPSFEQKGIREPLLCPTCETKLSKWETYARGVLVGGVPVDVRRDGGVTWVEGIDYERFKLFQLSVLWRAGASRHVFFGKVRLAAHEERLRQMLLADDPGEPWHYCCLMTGIEHDGKLVQMVVQPTPFRIMGAPGLRFVFGGFFWTYRTASHRPAGQLLLEPCLQKSGRLGLTFEKLEDAGFYKDFVRRRGEKLKLSV